MSDTCDAVLLDIEGTITPISFVIDTLFPYAHDHAYRFLCDHWHEEDVREDVEALRALAEEQGSAVRIPELDEASEAAVRGAVRDFVQRLIHDDSKATALKSLQGKIWREGYERGSIRGEFYDDALRAMERWSARGIRIAIYSSGSVEAQQLLFRHSVEGDLTGLVAAWFDTAVGPKREPSSYETIAEELDVDPGRILFATDVVAEAEAASEAGLQVVVMARLGNPQQPAHRFPQESGFELM